ncbi:hypothetical protein LQZ19_04880 [Treponema primitia]|uniref:hypothetical protein n=1 Tax=Treponema primitia TaxID=88058 RepID=UPI0039815446
MAALLLFYPVPGILPMGFGIPGLFSTDLLWSGSWAYDGNMINRGDIRLRAHKPALTLRAQVTDKRPSPPGDGFEQGNTAFAAGLYHDTTGSRLLWGILDEGGLPARIKNVWNRGIPFAEQHQGAISDLLTEPSSTKEPGSYLWLGSPEITVPWIGPVRGFGSVLLDAENQAAFDGGFEARFTKKSALMFEGFYTRSHLPSKSPSAWFSETPPLPERDSDILAGTIFFNNPIFAAAADISWSQTFAYGEDLYGNLAFRIGDRPWRLSLAADAAGSRYVGRDGGATGAGFRAAARLERRGKRSSLFRVNGTVRAAGIGDRFYKGSALFYYHFPTAPVKSTHLFWPSRASLTLNRDASDLEKIADSIDILAGFRFWEIPLVFQGSLDGIYTDQYTFGSAKISGETSYTLTFLQFGTKLGYKIKKNGKTQAETSASITARGKWGRFSIKASSADFPEDWDLGVSWRVQL